MTKYQEKKTTCLVRYTCSFQWFDDINIEVYMHVIDVNSIKGFDVQLHKYILNRYLKNSHLQMFENRNM